MFINLFDPQKLRRSIQVMVSAILCLLCFYYFQLPHFTIIACIMGVFFVGPNMEKIRNLPLITTIGFPVGALIGLLFIHQFAPFPLLGGITILIWIAIFNSIGDFLPELKIFFNIISVIPLVLLSTIVTNDLSIIAPLTGIVALALPLGSILFFIVRHTLFHQDSLTLNITQLKPKRLSLKTFCVTINIIISIILLFGFRYFFTEEPGTLFAISIGTAFFVADITVSESFKSITIRALGAGLGAIFGFIGNVIMAHFPFIWLSLLLIVIVVGIIAYYAQLNLKSSGIAIQLGLAYMMTINPTTSLGTDLQAGFERALGILLGCAMVCLVNITINWKPWLQQKMKCEVGHKI